MTMRRKRAGLLCLFAIPWLLSAGAAPQVVTITAKGTIYNGIDHPGIFGAAHAPLKGEAFDLVLTFDSFKATENVQQCNVYLCVSQSTGQGEHSPGTAVLTIKGRQYVFGTALEDGPVPNLHIWSNAGKMIGKIPNTPQQLSVGFDVRDDASRVYIGVGVTKPLSVSLDPDWRSPLCETGLAAGNLWHGEFEIHRSGLMAQGYLRIDTLSVGNGCPTPPPRCSITSQTVETVPKVPNSRTRIGVGEAVILTASVPVNWTKSGEGSLTDVDKSTSPKRGTVAYFTAPYSKATTVITGIADDSSCSLSFSTIQPEGLIFQRLEAPGYGLQPITSKQSGLSMWSVAFLIPGDVSFLNIGIAEEDVPPAKRFITHSYDPPVLVGVANISAWLIGCDRDQQPIAPFNHSESYWVYTWGSNLYATANKKAFSNVQTTIKHVPFVGNYIATKGQIAALSGNQFIDTPSAPKAILSIPSNSQQRLLAPIDYDGCKTAVLAQFGVH